MKRLIVIGCLLGLLCGCTGTSRSREFNVWANWDITLYAAGGQPIGHWVSRGKVYSEGHSDGYYFTDSKTGKVMTVAGTVVIVRVD